MEVTISHHTQKLEGIETDISTHHRHIQRMQRQLKELDDESIEVFAHQDNTSPDPSKRTKIREENTAIIVKINTQEALISAQQAKIDSLHISKDRAFDIIRDLKKDLRDIRKNIETHDTHILKIDQPWHFFIHMWMKHARTTDTS